MYAQKKGLGILFFERILKRRDLITRFIKFGFVGGTGFVVDTSTFWLLMGLGVPHLQARAMSYWVSASSNWFLNRTFTFSDAPKTAPVKQWLSYLLMAVGSFVLNWGSYYVLTSQFEFFIRYKTLALIIGVGVGMMFNFSVANYLIFKRKKAISVSHER